MTNAMNSWIIWSILCCSEHKNIFNNELVVGKTKSKKKMPEIRLKIEMVLVLSFYLCHFIYLFSATKMQTRIGWHFEIITCHSGNLGRQNKNAWSQWNVDENDKKKPFKIIHHFESSVNENPMKRSKLTTMSNHFV